MIEFLHYAAIFFFGYYTHKILFMIKLAVAMKNHFAMETETTDSKEIPSFYTENLKDSILLYDVNNTFIAQANTLEQLIKIAHEKSILQELYIKHNDKILYINNGKILTQ